MNGREWERFAGFFADHGLISTRPSAAELLTNELQLRRRGADRARVLTWPREPTPQRAGSR